MYLENYIFNNNNNNNKQLERRVNIVREVKVKLTIPMYQLVQTALLLLLCPKWFPIADTVHHTGCSPFSSGVQILSYFL